MGLASGQEVKTDCSVNWTAPDGKVYCFSTEASKQTFLKDPDENIEKAREFYLAKIRRAKLLPRRATPRHRLQRVPPKSSPKMMSTRRSKRRWMSGAKTASSSFMIQS